MQGKKVKGHRVPLDRHTNRTDDMHEVHVGLDASKV
jgi:hypothetical protein